MIGPPRMEAPKTPSRGRAAWSLAALAATAGLLAAALGPFGDEPETLGIVPLTGLDLTDVCDDTAAGSEWILVVGACLGLWGRVTRPGWRLRALALVGLAASVVAIQVAAWPRIEACSGRYGFRVQPDDTLWGRFERHHNWRVIRDQAYLLAGRIVAGRELRLGDGSRLEPRKLLALARPARLVSWEAPPLPARRAEVFLRARATARLGQRPRNEDPFELLLVAPRADEADYFVAIRLGDTDFLVDGPTWEQLVRDREG